METLTLFDSNLDYFQQNVSKLCLTILEIQISS